MIMQILKKLQEVDYFVPRARLLQVSWRSPKFGLWQSNFLCSWGSIRFIMTFLGCLYVTNHCYPVNYLPVIKGGRKLSHTMMSIH